MPDKEPGTYRPRRALSNPAEQPTPEPADPGAPVPAAEQPTADETPAPAEPDVPASAKPDAPDVPASAKPDAPDASATADESAPATKPITFAPRRRPVDREEDDTAILPRTRRQTHAYAEDDEEPAPRLGRRARTALLIGAVAAVMVVGLAIVFTVANVGSRTVGTAPPSVAAPSVAAPTATTTSVGPAPGGPLTDASLLDVTGAEALDEDVSWKVAATETGTSEEAARPACFGDEPVEGQPTAAQTLLRLLTGSGRNPPGALHQASAYATVEEAAQAYAVAARTLGTCAVPGSYLVSGHVVSGLGDQAVGVVANALTDGRTIAHTLVLSRTGRVLNLVDVTRGDDAVDPAAVAEAAAGYTGRQCGTAAGKCAEEVSVTAGPPPLGGDEVGFLAAGDLPPVGDTPVVWAGTPPELPDEAFVGSGCETLNWATTPAQGRTSRVYLLQDTAASFGLNQVVLTLRTDAAARDLVDKIRDDLNSCAKRKLTATVGRPTAISGVGADKAKVAGYATTVRQRSTRGTEQYRVGIVATGPKVVYTFLNRVDDYDVSEQQWRTVAVRAGQRASQVD